jgi:thiaminase/transcriptional activator TenA
VVDAQLPSNDQVPLTLARRLWIENTDLAQQALASPFVRALAIGTLPLKTFKAYIAQDAFFLDAFARAYGLALSHASDVDSLAEFARLIRGAVEELRLHRGYAAKWGVSLDRVTPLAATQGYTAFLLATASLRNTGETCAALTPCMRLYADIGQKLEAGATSIGVNPYAEWIETYAAPEFESLAATLERLLDRHGADTGELHAAYRRAMQLEVDFFAAFSL